jgi:branched-chain amino acid transport system ATP-binding protein
MDELGERIRDLRGEMAVLLVEHRVDLVMSVCDRVVVLDFGKRIAHGTPAEVRSDQRVVDAYLGVEVDAAG